MGEHRFPQTQIPPRKMGYDLSVTHVPYVVTKDTTAHKLMWQLMKLLSNNVPFGKRHYETEDEWYATALGYIYFVPGYPKFVETRQDIIDSAWSRLFTVPLGYDQYQEVRDCRG